MGLLEWSTQTVNGITACPECRTRFRVTTEQLRARNGEVRCGRCQHVFNAYQTWEDEVPPLLRARTVPPKVPETRGGPLPEGIPVEGKPQAEVQEDQPELASFPLQKIQPDSPPPSPPLPEDAPLISPPPPEAADMLDFEVQAAKGSPEPATGPCPEGVTETPEVQRTPRMDDQAVRVVKVVPPASEVPRPRASPSMPMYAPSPKPRPQWPWWILNLLLLTVLSGQGLYAFRDHLAAHWPQSRPVLAAACVWANCQIHLLKNLEWMSIESSDLQADPAHENLVAVSSTLRNRAPYPQAYPLLELSLTNARDEVLVRRHFTPEEYLPPGLSPEKGFAPGGELPVRLTVDIGDLKADGYRLYLL